MLPSLLLSNIVAKNRGEGGVVYVTLEDCGESGLSSLDLALWVWLVWSHPWPFCSNPLLMAATESASDLFQFHLDLVSFPCCLSLPLLSKD